MPSAFFLCVFVWMDIFAEIGLKQYTVCLYWHFCGDLFLRIYLSLEYRENKFYKKINCFTLGQFVSYIYLFRNSDDKFSHDIRLIYMVALYCL